jgi:hypothetical protein
MLRRSATTRAVRTAMAVLAGAFTMAAAAPAAGAATISGVAFKDLDRDGAWQTSEPVLPAQEIHLFAATGPFLARAVTDAFGRYAFADLADGEYRVAYDAPTWWTLRDNWVPTTTASLRPTQSVTLSGAASADFGWRAIVRSTDPLAPISTYTGPSGLRVSSYDDVVSARTLHDALATARIGAEAPYTEVRFDLYGGSMTTSSASRANGGPYDSYSAVSYVGYTSWLDSGDRTLTHEYGHAWSLYYAYIVQQDPTLGSYLRARGLEGDARVNTSYTWSSREMIAEDYRQLFGSANARGGAQINGSIPPAADVPGLAGFLADTFTTAPPAPAPAPEPTPQPTPEPTPEPTPAPQLTALTMNPDPVRTTGAVSVSSATATSVTVRIYTTRGALVRSLLSDAAKPAGTIDLLWDRKDAAGRRVGKGTYRLQVDAVDAAGRAATSTTTFAVA